MNISKNKTLYICGCCKKELPEDAFYTNRKTRKPDNYCKECRKSASRGQYMSEKYVRIEHTIRNYPVITQIENHELRKSLVLHALQVVAESMERKKRKQWEIVDSEMEMQNR